MEGITPLASNSEEHGVEEEVRHFTPCMTLLIHPPQHVPEFVRVKEPGPQLPEDFHGKTEFEFFKLFLTAGVVSSIADFANAYAHRKIARAPFYGNSNGEWIDTTLQEMYSFFAVSLRVGLVKMPTIGSYWSSKPLFHGIPNRERIFGILLQKL